MTDANQENVKAAVRAHETLTNSLIEGFRSIIISAGGALKLLTTINAGGIIALLGFIGATAGKGIFGSIEPFDIPISLFGIGLICSAVATCGMYFAQLMFGMSQSKKRLDFRHPYVHDTPESVCRQKMGTAFQITTIFFASASFLLFVAGLYFCRSLLLVAKL